MQLHAIKVHYKVIEIMAVRWLGAKLMQIFKETTTMADLRDDVTYEGWG